MWCLDENGPHGFIYLNLVPCWWNSFRKDWGCGLVGGGESLGLALRFQKFMSVPVSVILPAWCLWSGCELSDTAQAASACLPVSCHDGQLTFCTCEQASDLFLVALAMMPSHSNRRTAMTL